MKVQIETTTGLADTGGAPVILPADGKIAFAFKTLGVDSQPAENPSVQVESPLESPAAEANTSKAAGGYQAEFDREQLSAMGSKTLLCFVEYGGATPARFHLSLE